MSIFNFIGMAGGLALFLYGMSMMSAGLERLSGSLMEKVIQKMTGNVFTGILFGALVTAAIQSSSATTVIVVGLVNAGLLKLRGAVGVIMGANIGTTITGQILRLTKLEGNANAGFMLSLLKPSNLAAIFAVAGILMYMISKNRRVKNAGEILVGLGVLFQGMLIMQDRIAPLAESETFKTLFATLQNPILGVLAGTLFTALIQSSSASIGILQALSSTGAITFSAAFPIIMGQNIGTCATPLISSIGANKNAKRAAMIHLYFNIIGTIVFLVVVYIIQYTFGLPFWDDVIDTNVIANFHTLFNITVTILFIPFYKLLEKLARITIRDEQKDTGGAPESAEELLDERFFTSPVLAINQASKAVVQMGKYAQYNFREMRTLFTRFDQKTVDRIMEYEDAIDRMEDKLNGYLVKLGDCDLSEADNRSFTMILHLLSEFERIGDYTINIVESAEELYDEQIRFSESAMNEFKVICDAVDEIIEMSITCAAHGDMTTLLRIEPLEEVIDQLKDTLKARHIQRFKTGECVIDAGVVFLDVLTNLERISDHCSNVAVYVIAKVLQREEINRHEYIQKMHKGDSKEYTDCYESYAEKYKI